jgi:hypothetical protein
MEGEQADMSNLTEHAKRELREAGWFDTGEDSLYGGMIGEDVMALIEKFEEQGHSGGSAAIVTRLFSQLAQFHVLNPLKNPMALGEYIDHSDKGRPCFQSTRKSTVFSEDGGKTWYDLDKKVPWWKRLFGVKRGYITFA